MNQRVNEQTERNLVVIARRYWPYCDDASLRLMHWLDQLQSEGIRSTVLTSRWHPSWPDEFELRGVRIHRLQPAANTNWNESHFQRNVLQWLHANLDRVGWIYVDRIDTLASVLLSKSNRLDRPILARAGLSDSNVGLAPSVRSPLPMQIDIAHRAKTVIVPSASVHRLMIQHGVASQSMVRIDDFIPIPTVRTPDIRKSTLHALAKINSDFLLPDSTPLVLHLGHCQMATLQSTLQAMCDLLDSGAMFRTWIINPGLPYDQLYEFIRDRGWHRELLLFDSFDDVESLLQVADLIWVSNPEEAIQFTLPATISSGIPCLIREHPDLEPLFGPGIHACVYDSPTSLALQLHRWYAQPRALARSVESLQAELHSRHPTKQWMKQWKMVLESSQGTHGYEN